MLQLATNAVGSIMYSYNWYQSLPRHKCSVSEIHLEFTENYAMYNKSYLLAVASGA